jgi:hypothetical protein
MARKQEDHRSSMATSAKVIFEQHPAGNCIPSCSKRLFFVACRNLSANVGVRRRGASPCRSFRCDRCLGDNEGNGKTGR